jgi:serine-type D-Ala-D-Ala carboxypeptidase (penicillin-binding protein 5/6)
MHSLRNYLSCALFIFVLGFPFVKAHAITPPETLAEEAIILDAETGTTLFDKKADERMPTASMSKVMTMLVVFDALKSGQLKLDQTVPVSEKAWKMQGSKMFIHVGDMVSVQDLIRGVIIQSGNDACVALAEAIAGSEEAFAELMNKKAKEIGMKNSNFTNSSGWPDPNHYSTPRDLAIMAKYLINNYPEEYKYYSEKEFTFNNIKQGNRNPLLYQNIGADGVKTGHTEEAGYGLIGSAVQGDRRVVMVINGTKSMQERADESAKLMDWALKGFKNFHVTKKDMVVAEASVVLGQARTVPLVAAQDLKMTLPRTMSGIKLTLNYNTPLKAPLKAGDKVGEIKIEVPNMPSQTVPAIVKTDVPEANFFKRLFEKLMLTLVGTPKFSN